jgi:surface protein
METVCLSITELEEREVIILLIKIGFPKNLAWILDRFKLRLDGLELYKLYKIYRWMIDEDLASDLLKDHRLAEIVTRLLNITTVIVKRRLNDRSIHEAVNTWCNHREAAMERYGHISTWDTSRVTDMSWLFYNKGSFNDDISSWDVSNVTKMQVMFSSATSFNKPLNKWNVSSVQNMTAMFSNASAFNQSLDNWDVSNVMNMTGLFMAATSFNQSLATWNVSKKTKTRDMFLGAHSFNNNQSLPAWYKMLVMTKRQAILQNNWSGLSLETAFRKVSIVDNSSRTEE